MKYSAACTLNGLACCLGAPCEINSNLWNIDLSSACISCSVFVIRLQLGIRTRHIAQLTAQVSKCGVFAHSVILFLQPHIPVSNNSISALKLSAVQKGHPISNPVIIKVQSGICVMGVGVFRQNIDFFPQLYIFIFARSISMAELSAVFKTANPNDGYPVAFSVG